MKLQNLFALATAVAASTWATTAQAIDLTPNIVLTENSDTSLSATISSPLLNGPLSVVNINPDEWFVYGLGAYLIDGSAQWAEPDASGDVNLVESGRNSTWGLGLLVNSDVGAGSGTPLANGATDTQDFNYLDVDFLSVDVTFNDLGDSNGGSTVPDSTTTMPLLGAAVTAMFGLARRVRK